MILIGSIEQESEKALKIDTIVKWSGSERHKSFWFPKSICKQIRKEAFEVQDWFINKLECENCFHGYFMYFVLVEKNNG